MNNCKESGKFMYESRTAAEAVLNRKKKYRQKHKHDNKRFVLKMDAKEICIYKCPFCNKFHLAGKR